MLECEDEAVQALSKALDSDNLYLRTFALNTIDSRDMDQQEITNKLVEISKTRDLTQREYDNRMINNLLKKWELN